MAARLRDVESYLSRASVIAKVVSWVDYGLREPIVLLGVVFWARIQEIFLPRTKLPIPMVLLKWHRGMDMATGLTMKMIAVKKSS